MHAELPLRSKVSALVPKPKPAPTMSRLLTLHCSGELVAISLEMFANPFRPRAQRVFWHPPVNFGIVKIVGWVGGGNRVNSACNVLVGLGHTL